MIDLAIHHARTVLTALVFILVAGTVAYVNIPREAAPDVQIPIIYVSLHHEGISPEDSERLLVKVMEQKLNAIEGVQEMSSSAYEGGGHVLLEFDAGFDPDSALSDVRAQVDLAKGELPEDADDPIVREVNISLFPILVVTLSGDVPERTLLRLAKQLSEKIKGLPQILKADITGERDEELRIVIDPVKVEAYGLTAPDIISRMRRNNVLVAAGVIDTGQGRFAVKLPGLVETAEDLRNFPLLEENEAIITVADVASLERGFQDPTSFARLRGEKTIAIEISKRVGENIIETIEKVRELVLQQSADWPPWIRIGFSQDKGDHIRTMIADLQNSIILSIILVMIVIIWAIGLRSGLLVAIAIPGSFLAGILVLSLMGLTINIVVLFALILTVGILVDGVIVIVEYADRQMNIGQPRQAAYSIASRNMAAAVIVSTSTTLFAFMPLLFWPGIVGQFMQYMPITLIAVLSASLLMALIFVPVLGSYIGVASRMSPQGRRFLDAGESGDFSGLTLWAQRYLNILNFCLRRPLAIILTCVVALVAVFGAYITFGQGLSFFPEVEPDNVIIQVQARGNLSIHEKDTILRAVENRILEMDDITTVYTRTGKQRDVRQDSEDTIGSVLIEFTPWETRQPVSVILKRVEEKLSVIPGIRISIRKEEAGPPIGKAIQVQIQSHNYDALLDTARDIAQWLEGAEDYINIEDGLPVPGIEWQFSINRAEAARYGADAAAVGNALRLITKGMKLTDYRPDGSLEEIDIVARFPEHYRRIDEFDRIHIETINGSVPISNFITRQAQPLTGTLYRSDRTRVITIKADIREGILADNKVTELKQWIAGQSFHSDVNIVFKGEDEEQKKAQAFLGKAFMAAAFMIVFVLIARFNSFYQAFLIFSAIVLSTVGVMFGLLVTNQPFDIIMCGIGIIALAGIVVNNNIILIDTWTRIRSATPPTSLIDAQNVILRTSVQRVRPVLLTTITTITGLSPMFLGVNIDFIERRIILGGSSIQWWQSLSSTIIFGLTFATLLTLIVTPSALMFWEKRRWKKKN